MCCSGSKNTMCKNMNIICKDSSSAAVLSDQIKTLRFQYGDGSGDVRPSKCTIAHARVRRHQILQRGFGCFDVLGKRHKYVEGKQVNIFMIHIIYA